MVISSLAATACATSTGTTPRATATLSPSPAASAEVSPSPAAPVTATGLVLTGSLSGQVTTVKPQPGCDSGFGGLVASDRFSIAGIEYELVVDIANYHGPGTYPAPPARVSIHKTAIDDNPRLLTGTSGTITVAPGGRAGTVDEDLRTTAGPAHVTGAWSC